MSVSRVTPWAVNGSYVTSLSSPAVNVPAGALLVSGFFGQDSAGTVSVSDNAGNTWTVLTVLSGTNGVEYLAYCLSAKANAATVVKWNCTTSQIVSATGCAYSDSAGGTWSFDQAESQQSAYGTPASVTFASTPGAGVIAGIAAEYYSDTEVFTNTGVAQQAFVNGSGTAYQCAAEFVDLITTGAQSNFAPTVADTEGGYGGYISLYLGSFLLTAASSGVTGSLSVTDSGVTFSAHAAAKASATLSKTLGSSSLSCAAALRVSGSESTQLAGATLSAHAADLTAISASLAVQCGATSLSAHAAVPDTASVSKQLSGASLSSQSAVKVSAHSSAICGAAVLSSHVSDAVTDTESTQLGAATLAANASVSVAATEASQLGGATLSAAAHVGSGIAASLGKTLGVTTLSSSAKALASATLTRALARTTLSASVTDHATGTVGVVLSGTTLTAAGSPTVSAAFTAALQAASLAASGAAQVGATLAKTLAPAALNASVTVTAGYTASLAFTLGGAVLSAAGSTGSAPQDIVTLTPEPGFVGLAASGSLVSLANQGQFVTLR